MGGDGHGHGHGPPYVIPDYRIYKVEDAPELMEVQRLLAARGLKDPWLRNEVWRYNRNEWGTIGSRARATFLTGFKYGFAAFVLTIVGTEIYNRQFPDEHDHGHGGHH